MRTEHRPILPGPAKVAAGDAATAIADGRRAFGIAHAQGLVLARPPRQTVRWHHGIDAGYTENQRAFPQSSEQKPGLGFPVARIGGLISLASGAVLAHAVAACKGKGTGEQTLLRGLLPLIVKSDILLADALLATWWIVAEIRRRGGDVLMVQQEGA
ncbi:MAG: hypothetical protein IPP59_09090 [Betaproteobacteria bacterium]|nr:hypothetical protein [Candidatus Dechloromonas phosphorivorans]